MSMHYSDQTRETEPHALPNVEVFHATLCAACGCNVGDYACACVDAAAADQHGPTETMTGWFWWACFPGCLPDGDPHGPFATEADALADARENAAGDAEDDDADADRR